MKKALHTFLMVASAALFCTIAAHAQTLTTDALQGMNWANPTDNSAGAAWPSGMTGSETYNQAYLDGQTVGNAVLKAGGKAVRMPITPTLATSSDWQIYTGAIDGVVSTGVKVILCYWPYQSSVVPDVNAWYTMWDAVNGTYGNTMMVRYEPVNEPSGYNATDLTNLYAGFLARYNPPARKCILDGTGYAQNVVPIGADSRLTNQLLGLHSYHWFWGSPANWQTDYNTMANAVGAYAARTVVTEIGVQTQGRSPSVPFWQQWEYSLQPDQALLSGGLAWARNNNVATLAWSGIDDSDLYHWFYAFSNLTEANPEVANMFRWSWKESTYIASGTYRLLNRADSDYLDGLGYTSNGSSVGQWSSSGNNNQKWKVVAVDSVWFTLQNVSTGLYLDGMGRSSNGSLAGQWAYSGSANQQWAFEVTDSGYYRLINRGTGICIDTGGQTTNGAAMQNSAPSSSYNQQWTLTQ